MLEYSLNLAIDRMRHTGYQFAYSAYQCGHLSRFRSNLATVVKSLEDAFPDIANQQPLIEDYEISDNGAFIVHRFNNLTLAITVINMDACPDLWHQYAAHVMRNVFYSNA